MRGGEELSTVNCHDDGEGGRKGQGLLAPAPDPCNRPDLYARVDHCLVRYAAGMYTCTVVALQRNQARGTLARGSSRSLGQAGPRH